MPENQFRMICPKCGSHSFTVRRDQRAYVHKSQPFELVFSCRCGKQLFGDQIQEEYDRQKANWDGSPQEEPTEDNDAVERAREEQRRKEQLRRAIRRFNRASLVHFPTERVHRQRSARYHPRRFAKQLKKKLNRTEMATLDLRSGRKINRDAVAGRGYIQQSHPLTWLQLQTEFDTSAEVQSDSAFLTPVSALHVLTTLLGEVHDGEVRPLDHLLLFDLGIV